MDLPRTSASAPDDTGGRTGPGISRQGMRRFIIVFGVLLLVGFGLLLAPFDQPAIVGFTTWIVHISAWLVSLFGAPVRAAGNVLANPVTGYSIRVEDACNASNVTILLWAAILAFPTAWRHKALGLLAGTLLLHAVNLLRIVSLFYIGQHKRDWFEFAHLYLWESLIVLVTLVIFWSWVQRIQRPGRV